MYNIKCREEGKNCSGSFERKRLWHRNLISRSSCRAYAEANFKTKSAQNGTDYQVITTMLLDTSYPQILMTDK